MIGEVIANTNVIRYLMAAMGILGVIAKLVNQVTLNRLIRQQEQCPRVHTD